MKMRVTESQFKQMQKATLPKRRKYLNNKVIVDGIQFDSSLEAGRWNELVLLQRGGHISDLRRQVPFPYSANGKVVFTLIIDHVYRDEGGNEIVEDVKALSIKRDGTAKRPTCTPVYRLKKRLIEASYGIKIYEWPEKPKRGR
jgi:hypothetical protein